MIHVHISLSSHKRPDGWYVREQWSNQSGWTEYGPVPDHATALALEEERAEAIGQAIREHLDAAKDV